MFFAFVEDPREGCVRLARIGDFMGFLHWKNSSLVNAADQALPAGPGGC
jgi:hypothetical protein